MLEYIDEDKHEIFGLKIINDETISLVASDKARIIHLNVLFLNIF